MTAADCQPIGTQITTRDRRCAEDALPGSRHNRGRESGQDEMSEVGSMIVGSATMSQPRWLGPW
jgi:hypothetical protein